VRQSDMDVQGHVNNCTYVDFFENTRIAAQEFQKTHDRSQLALLHREIFVDFHAETVLGDAVRVEMQLLWHNDNTINNNNSNMIEGDDVVFSLGDKVMYAFRMFKVNKGKNSTSNLSPEEWLVCSAEILYVAVRPKYFLPLPAKL